MQICISNIHKHKKHPKYKSEQQEGLVIQRLSNHRPYGIENFQWIGDDIPGIETNVAT